MNDIDVRLALEKEYHESEDFLRDNSSLIVGVYRSGVFDEAEQFHLDVLGDITGALVLDYGCGTGGSSRLLKARGANVIAFDLSYARLQVAKKGMIVDNGEYIPKFTQCAAELLPFQEGTFDYVIGKQILHHLNIDLAVEEIKRVLRPGGKATFLEPLIHNPFLEGYRRLTPHLRSPTEKALSLRDVERIGRNFSHWEQKEFCLFSILPALMSALTGPKAVWINFQRQLQYFDKRLIKSVPYLGKYCWEIVITLEK